MKLCHKCCTWPSPLVRAESISRSPSRPLRWPRGSRVLHLQYQTAPNWRSRPTCVDVLGHRLSWYGVRRLRQSTASALSCVMKKMTAAPEGGDAVQVWELVMSNQNLTSSHRNHK